MLHWHHGAMGEVDGHFALLRRSRRSGWKPHCSTCTTEPQFLAGSHFNALPPQYHAMLFLHFRFVLQEDAVLPAERDNSLCYSQRPRPGRILYSTRGKLLCKAPSEWCLGPRVCLRLAISFQESCDEYAYIIPRP